MQMHEGGQIKTIPIRRIGHATRETIYPLTRLNIDVHGWGWFECLFILRRPI